MVKVLSENYFPKKNQFFLTDHEVHSGEYFPKINIKMKNFRKIFDRPLILSKFKVEIIVSKKKHKFFLNDHKFCRILRYRQFSRIEELEQAPDEEKKIEGEGEIDRGGCKEALRRANCNR